MNKNDENTWNMVRRRFLRPLFFGCRAKQMCTEYIITGTFVKSVWTISLTSAEMLEDFL